MKTGIKGLIMAAMIIFLTGCQSTNEQKEAEPAASAEPTALAEAVEKVESIMPDSDGENAEPKGFELLDSQPKKAGFIPFTDCVCEYDNGDFQIYTKYLDEKNEYFSTSGTLIYMQTADNDMQIFTANEYCIDEENGILYYVERDEYDSFISIYKYFAALEGESHKVVGAKKVTTYLVEEWLAEAYELTLNDSEENFWNIKLFITALESEQGVMMLKGEAFGVYEPTDEYCHIDWTVNTETEEIKSVVHVKKIYDKEKDKEIFEACDKAFQEKDEGKWLELSDLEKEKWKDLIDWNDDITYEEKNPWMRVDIDGDNLPELIGVRAYKDEYVLPIDCIYTYVGGIMKPLDRVYWDPTDHSEFIYLGSSGNLVYENCDGGMITQGRYSWCQFDEAWRREMVVRLEFEYFEGETEISDDEEQQFLKEQYPDTYGSRGAGCYCYRNRLKTGENEAELIREEITLEEFLKEYEQISGFDFFEANSYYEFIRK